MHWWILLFLKKALPHLMITLTFFFLFFCFFKSTCMDLQLQCHLPQCFMSQSQCVFIDLSVILSLVFFLLKADNLNKTWIVTLFSNFRRIKTESLVRKSLLTWNYLNIRESRTTKYSTMTGSFLCQLIRPWISTWHILVIFSTRFICTKIMTSKISLFSTTVIMYT